MPDSPNDPMRNSHANSSTVVLGGLVHRLWLIVASPLGSLDADEAVTALMAQRFLSLEPSVFFWGQHYGGTIDAMVTAPVVWLTGPSVAGPKLVAVAFFAVSCVLTWRIGRHLFDDQTGIVAACLLWVASPAVVWWSTKTRGFYGAGIVLALAATLIVVRLSGRAAPERDADRRDRRDMAALGLVTGLAWWTTPIAFFVIVPVLVDGAWRRRDLWRFSGLAAATFVVGGLPWWVFNVSRGFASLHSPVTADMSYLERLDGFVSVVIPMLAGFRTIYTADWAVPPLVAAAAGPGVLLVAWRTRHRASLLLAVLVGYPILAAVSPTTEFVGEPRYAYFLAPFLALLLAHAVSRGLGRFAVVVPGALLVVTIVGTVALARFGADSRHWDLAAPATGPLVAALHRDGIDHLRAEYWLAYRLTYESDLVAAPTESSRDRTIDDEVRDSGSPVVAFYRGSAAERRFAHDTGSARVIYEDDDYVVYVVAPDDGRRDPRSE